MDKKNWIGIIILVLVVAGFFIYKWLTCCPTGLLLPNEDSPLTCYNIQLSMNGDKLGNNYFFVNMAESEKSVQIEHIENSGIDFCYFTSDLVNKDLLIVKIDSSNPNFDFADNEVRMALQMDTNYAIGEYGYGQIDAIEESFKAFGEPTLFSFSNILQEQKYTEYELSLDLETKEVKIINETYDPENILMYPDY